MPIIEVTSREFRQNQKSIFDRVDRGERVIIKRGTKQSYALVPISQGELIVVPEQDELIENNTNINNK